MPDIQKMKRKYFFKEDKLNYYLGLIENEKMGSRKRESPAAFIRNNLRGGRKVLAKLESEL